MPLYYLNIFDDFCAYDEEGVECIDINAAKGKAVAGIRSLIIAQIQEGRPVIGSHHIEIRDANNVALEVIYFKDIIDLRI